LIAFVNYNAAAAPAAGDNAVWCQINTTAAFVSTETCTYTTINSTSQLALSNTTLTATDDGSNATNLNFTLSLVEAALPMEWNTSANLSLFLYESNTSAFTTWTDGVAIVPAGIADCIAGFNNLVLTNTTNSTNATNSNNSAPQIEI
jgi:hypothetical protein